MHNKKRELNNGGGNWHQKWKHGSGSSDQRIGIKTWLKHRSSIQNGRGMITLCPGNPRAGPANPVWPRCQNLGEEKTPRRSYATTLVPAMLARSNDWIVGYNPPQILNTSFKKIPQMNRFNTRSWFPRVFDEGWRIQLSTSFHYCVNDKGYRHCHLTTPLTTLTIPFTKIVPWPSPAPAQLRPIESFSWPRAHKSSCRRYNTPAGCTSWNDGSFFAKGTWRPTSTSISS